MSKASDILGKANAESEAKLFKEIMQDEMSVPSELHTHPEVGHIAGVGMRHPEKLTLPEIQTLCGEVDRHIRRMKGKG